MALLASGCNVFDPDLYMRRGDGGAEGGGSLPRLNLSDRCSADAPLVSGPGDYAISTTGFENNLRDLVSCVGRELPGTDGFFRVRMTEGELWHFHVRGAPGANPAIYLVPNCDERTCAIGVDECGVGRDEHLSFRARETREYLVGIDSVMTGGATYDLSVVRPVCGNGMLEHGESCDDSNRTPGDGCDATCRTELRDDSPEREPNDDATNANVVGGASPPVTVQGRLGGGCDFDTYALDVPAGGSVRVTMLDVNGAECDGDAPLFALSFLLPDGRTVSGGGVISGTNRCPAITEMQPFAQRLATAGTYYVRVSLGTEVPNVINYRLRFEVIRP